MLEKHDLSVSGYEGVLVRTELAPGAKEPPHTHPGDIFGYVQEGTLTLSMNGKPTTTLKSGEVFFVPAGQIHSGENHGDVAVKLLVTFFVEKGKPLTSPVKLCCGFCWTFEIADNASNEGCNGMVAIPPAIQIYWRAWGAL